MSLFQRILQSVKKPPTGVEAEFREFKETFRLSSEMLFFDYIRKEGVVNLVDWFDHSHPAPEATAFVRLGNDATRKGMNIWEQSGISMTLESESGGGEPSQHSQDCLSVLAQILGFTITAYYRASPGGELMKKEFHA